MQKILLSLIIIGAANFAIFVYESVIHGGDAINGKVVGGHYFLGMHGGFTEVSRERYENSKIHAYSVMISWPFVMLCAYFYNKGRPGSKKTSDAG